MDDRSGPRINWWSWLGWAVTLIALFFVTRWLLRLDHSVWIRLRHLHAAWLVASLLVFQLWFLMRFVAWEIIVKRHGSESQRHQTLRRWTLSELARYVPGNLWSFAAKYRSSVTGGSSRVAAVQALAIEASFQLAGAAVVAPIFFDAQHLWWIAMIVVLLFPIIIPAFLTILARWRHWGAAPKVTMTESLGLLLWYCLVWIVFGLATAMIYWSFPNAMNISWSWLVGVNVMAWLIGYISVITPMGLGVREVAFVKLTSGVLDGSLSSLVALITRLWFVLSELIFLGLVLIWHAIRRRA